MNNIENGIEMREPIINISPLYNPLGKGEKTEFSDEKSYQQMFNKHTMDIIDERNKKTSRLRKNAGIYMENKIDNDKIELMSMLFLLRQDLHGELNAISDYENHIQNINIPEIKDKLIEIVNEERHHSVELQELIDKYQRLYGDFKEV